MTIQRIVVLGDSVSWGQGLVDEHKYANLVAQGLATAVSPTLEMYAHSGAIIDAQGALGDQADQCDSYSHEIPLPAPSIRAQVRKVAQPETVDLVLLNGGINDVSVYRILNPITRKQDLSRYIQNACYSGMKVLLTEAAAAFANPQSRIVVTGYYPYLSSDSDQSLIEDLLSILGISLPDHLVPDPLLQRVTQLAMQFWKESNAALALAATEVAQQSRNPNKIVFIPGPLQESNAVFASDPWLFGLADGVNPQDEVAVSRKVACDHCYSDPIDLMQHEVCRIASVGHPNQTGAEKYASAILGVSVTQHS